jgi:hypothetical protein
MRSIVVFAIGLVLGGCALDTESSDDEVKSTKVCSTQHTGDSADGDSLTICDKTFTTMPFVRPPADKVSTTVSTIYVGIDLTTGGRFVTREGDSYALADSSGKVISLNATSSNAIVKSLRMPSNRNLYMIYRVQGEIGTGTDPIFNTTIPIIKATSAKPVILIDGKAIDTAQTFGAWEGTVAARTSDTSFDSNKRVKIRVSFTSVSGSAAHFAEWGGGKSLTDGDSYTVNGAIENFTTSVRADDGTCMPSLASLGANSPFAGAASGALQLQRIAGMHFPGDDEHVLTMPVGAKGWSLTAMGSFGRFLPSDLISTKPGSGDMTPHGTPSGAGIELTAVTSGGGGC